MTSNSKLSILFVTFYGPIEYIGRIMDVFGESTNSPNKKIQKIYDFPYLKYMNDEGLTNEKLSIKLIDEINKNNITHVFWFFFPENSTSLSDVKTKTKALNIFYNFDDPISFNVFLIKYAKYIDFFINPDPRNEKKYTYVLGKNIYTIPRYSDNIDHNINNINNINNTDNNNDIDNNINLFVDSIMNSNISDNIIDFDFATSSDVAIVIDDDYNKYDPNEKIICDAYIRAIKNVCIDNSLVLHIFGTANLESIYPDIYQDRVDMLTKTKLVIILDFKSGLDKGTNILINRCARLGTPILTNSNHTNNLVYERGTKKKSSRPELLTLSNMNIITSLLSPPLTEDTPIELTEDNLVNSTDDNPINSSNDNPINSTEDNPVRSADTHDNVKSQETDITYNTIDYMMDIDIYKWVDKIIDIIV